MVIALPIKSSFALKQVKYQTALPLSDHAPDHAAPRGGRRNPRKR